METLIFALHNANRTVKQEPLAINMAKDQWCLNITTILLVPDPSVLLVEDVEFFGHDHYGV